jgi:hypothetical protein
MPATTLQLTVATSELAARMREHLRGPGANPPPKVIWQARGQRVLLHLDSLELRAHDGWLLAGLDLQADQTGRQTLQLVFHLGKPGEGDGLTAAVTINTTTVGAAQLRRAGATIYSGCSGMGCLTCWRPRCGARAASTPARSWRYRAMAAPTSRL